MRTCMGTLRAGGLGDRCTLLTLRSGSLAPQGSHVALASSCRAGSAVLVGVLAVAKSLATRVLVLGCLLPVELAMGAADASAGLQQSQMTASSALPSQPCIARVALFRVY